MNTLEAYIKAFSQLKSDHVHSWPDKTLKRAPQKPLLLLALLDLASRGTLTPFVDMDNTLRALSELFTYYWRRLFSWDRKTTIALPFSRLHNEPLGYWKLIPKPGYKISKPFINSIKSANLLMNRCTGAKIAENLFLLMQDPIPREALREVLLTKYFSNDAVKDLKDQVLINSKAWDYSEKLLNQANKPRHKNEKEAEDSPYRDQGFRMAIVKLYGQRCAICGIRILTLEGHTVVNAAHIIPWNISHDDDTHNGMALCGNCHWAYDEGIAGVQVDFSMVISDQAMNRDNIPGYLVTLAGRKIFLPSDQRLWPATKYLDWHMKNVYLK